MKTRPIPIGLLTHFSWNTFLKLDGSSGGMRIFEEIYLDGGIKVVLLGFGDFGGERSCE